MEFSSQNTEALCSTTPNNLLQLELCLRHSFCPHLRKDLGWVALQWRERRGDGGRWRSEDLPQGEHGLLLLSLRHVEGGGSTFSGRG